MKPILNLLFAAVLLFTIKTGAQTSKQNLDVIKENTVNETDKLMVNAIAHYGSTKRNAKVQISILAYSPNGQERLLTFSNVTFGEDASIDNFIDNLPNGDNIIENAPLKGKTIKQYFAENEALYKSYLKEREKILQQLP